MDCPDGVLTKVKLLDMLSSILPMDNGRIVAELIFNTFDKDGNGWIDFNEFIMAQHCTASSSPEDKLRWVFQLYDKVSKEGICFWDLTLNQLLTGLFQKYSIEWNGGGVWNSVS